MSKNPLFIFLVLYGIVYIVDMYPYFWYDGQSGGDTPGPI